MVVNWPKYFFCRYRFLPTPLAVAWVNRLTFSSPPSLSSHLQIFVSLRYITFLLGTENAVGGRGSLAVYAILFQPLKSGFGGSLRESSLKKAAVFAF